MSYGPARSVEAHDTDAGGHTALWFWGMLGALAVGVGLFLSFAPESGQISLIVTTIDAAEIHELIGPLVILAGGAIVAGTMFAGAWRDYQFQENWILVLLQGAIGLFGVIVVILGVFGILERLDFYSLPGLPF